MNGYCKLCNQDYKDKGGVSSNFIKHLKRKHLSEYQQIFHKENEELSDDLDDRNDAQSLSSSSTNKTKQSRINDAIGKYLIIKCNMPLSLVENNSFRDFMQECNLKWNPISSKKLKNDVIKSFIDQMKRSMRDTLDTVQHVTLTIDAWSDRRCRSFIGITCHFINSKMEPQVLLIDLVRLKSPHTGENIYRTTERVLDHFNLKEKVFRIVTDNAAAMKKAYAFGLAVDRTDENDEPTRFDDENGLNSSPNTATDQFDGMCLIDNQMSTDNRGETFENDLENVHFQ